MVNPTWQTKNGKKWFYFHETWFTVFFISLIMNLILKFRHLIWLILCGGPTYKKWHDLNDVFINIEVKFVIIDCRTNKTRPKPNNPTITIGGWLLVGSIN